MANTAIGGFRFHKMRNGANRPHVEELPVASAYATGIFRGDPVKRASDGTIQAAAAGDTNVLGVADGVVRYKASDGTIKSGNFLPASTTYSGAPHTSNPEASIVRVILARDVIFEADANTAAASFTAAQSLIDNNADVAAGAGGSTTTGRSTYVLDNSSTGTATAQCRIVGIATDPLNDVTSTNWKALIEFNESTEVQFGTTGT